MSSLGALSSRIAGGAAWMIALRMGLRGLGFVSTIILARLLVPADFGLVAMAMTVASVLDTVLDLNFSIALITEPRSDRAYYDAAWTLSILRGAGIAIILVFAARPIATYFSDPRIVDIVYVFAAGALISGFQNVATANFTKDFQLHKNFILGMTAKLASFAVTVLAAVMFRNYWALVLGGFVGRTVTVLMSFPLCSFTPRLGLRKSKELLGFSSWLMINNVMNAITSQIDAVFLGRAVSAGALGIYRIAIEISSLPASEIMAPARQALYGGFVKWVGDREKFAANYVEALAVMLSIALPIAAGIGIVADPLVRTLLGGNWLQAVPIMRILVISAVVGILCDNGSMALNVLRKPQVNTVVCVAVGAFYVVALFIGVGAYGLLGAALAHAGSAVFYLFCNGLVLRRYMRTSLLAVFHLAWRTIVATAGMTAGLIYFQIVYVNVSGLSPPVELVLTTLAGIGLFAVIHGVMWAGLGPGGGAEARILETAVSLLRQ